MSGRANPQSFRRRWGIRIDFIDEWELRMMDFRRRNCRPWTAEGATSCQAFPGLFKVLHESARFFLQLQGASCKCKGLLEIARFFAQVHRVLADTRFFLKVQSFLERTRVVLKAHGSSARYKILLRITRFFLSVQRS